MARLAIGQGRVIVEPHDLSSRAAQDGIARRRVPFHGPAQAGIKVRLAGGDQAGQDASCTVTVQSVKVRELPEVDDDFAQMASEFDTVDELRADLQQQAEREKKFEQGVQARDKVLELLLERTDIPVPDSVVEAEVNQHLEQEGRLEDDEHRAEVDEQTRQAVKTQFLLDKLAEVEEVEVGQPELIEYLMAQAQQYGMDPNQFAQLIEFAMRYGKPVRIGANWGSLDQSLAATLMDENAQRAAPWDAGKVLREALIRSAVDSAERAVELGLGRDRIVLSAKVSGVQELVAVYRDLAARCDFALHLGLTEAGIGSKGMVASSAALAILMQEGIGDTIRISLTPEPGASRTKEVVVAQELLQTMGLRAFTPMVTACPGCGRTTSEFFQELAGVVQDHVREKMPEWKVTHPGAENMTLAVMGCVVNGPGESRHADIGISLPGTGEAPSAPVFIDGEKKVTLKGENIATEFVALIDEYVESRYARKAG